MTSELYNGKVILDFNEKVHKYTIDGKRVDGVTSILKIINKPALIGWAVRTDMFDLKRSILNLNRITEQDLDELIKVASSKHEEIKTVSADFGTGVHRIIEQFIKTGKVLLEGTTPETKHVVDLFIKWAKENVSEFRDSERVVYSRKLGYCGTLDFTCFLKGSSGLFVGDLKTTGRIYPEYWLQTAAYQLAYQEELGVNVEGRIIVRLKEDIEIQTSKDQKKDKTAFKSVLKLYRRLNELARHAR